jgi:uncharacterized protein (TIGR02996 family)
MTRHHPDAPAAFLAAIIADPANDGPRMLYADWLEEQGDAARAELIRVQCELATRPDDPLKMWDVGHHTDAGWAIQKRCEALRRRESALLDVAAAQDWFPFPASVVDEWWWRRGFVEEVRMPWSCEGIAAILAAAPVTRVVLTTWPDAYPLGRDRRVAWFHPDVPNGREPRTQQLPAFIFNLLDGYENRGASPTRVKWYNTRAEADTALRLALAANWPQVKTWRLPNVANRRQPRDEGSWGRHPDHAQAVMQHGVANATDWPL